MRKEKSPPKAKGTEQNRTEGETEGETERNSAVKTGACRSGKATVKPNTKNKRSYILACTTGIGVGSFKWCVGTENGGRRSKVGDWVGGFAVPAGDVS